MKSDMATAHPIVDINSFETALARARIAFSMNNAKPIYLTEHSFGMAYNKTELRHEIHTTLNIPFVHRLSSKASISTEDACFLALAHESGHIELNQRCVDEGVDPDYCNHQFSAIGIPLKSFKSKHFTAACHKETAIEAYCDAKLAEAIHKHFPAKANSLVKAVADIRHEDSNRPKRFGDDYKTAIVLDTVASQGFPIPPHKAAKLAFDHSQSSMGHAENLWLTTKRPLLLDFPKAVADFPDKLRTLRDKAFFHGKPPTTKP